MEENGTGLNLVVESHFVGVSRVRCLIHIQVFLAFLPCPLSTFSFLLLPIEVNIWQFSCSNVDMQYPLRGFRGEKARDREKTTKVRSQEKAKQGLETFIETRYYQQAGNWISVRIN